MKNLSLSTKVLIGVIAGIAMGFSFGEHVAWLSVIGDIFIGLLQMTVMPYIMISLIVNIGRLSMDKAKRLIKYGMIFLMLLLGIGLLALFVLPFSFPNWGSGSFYSSDFVQEAAPFDVVKLYIPANPFASMSNNMVPAVVLFSIFIGLGVMKLPNKETLLKPLDVMNKALNQVNKMIVKITPIGVFSIAAGVVSSLSWADLSRLQGYLLIYLVAVLVFTFMVLPYVIAIFTPYSTRTVFKMTRSTLITIFATGKIIVVFPQLIENIKEIIATEEGGNDEAKSEIDIIMPLAYPFPNLGTFMIFIFVPFAAWYSGHALGFSDYPLFLSSTFLSSFVAPITGLPFSLDVLDIPQETFNLFVVSTVLTDRIRVVLGAFHLITLTLLSISASQGLLKFKKAKFIQALIVVSITFAVSIFGMNKLLTENMKSIPTNSEIVNQFKIISPMQPYVILDKGERNPNWRRRNESTLHRIKRRGIIRIGFYENAMPFTFYNSDSALVGMGIDMAHQLASDLKVSIEFVPIKRGELVKGIKNDYYDIVMSDIFISNNYAEQLELSKPYLTVSLALVVKKDDDRFSSEEKIAEVDTFTICYFERKEVAEEYATSFQYAKTAPITDLNQFFNPSENDSTHYDAYLTSAERASALTIRYPGFRVVNPLPYHINNALVFPIANSNIWKKYIDNWIEFRKQDGTIDRIYSQWILGHEFKKKERNWNLYDDVIVPKYFSDTE
jgi:Na+/H+-dicarboxylate symporter/ABC-type amino acid transport substrate-binding protein